MTEHLNPDEQDALRLLSRSPHPYHHPNSELLDPSNKFSYRPIERDSSGTRLAVPPASREVTPSSDSGTEADDEHFLKGLPAPRRLHKGLRGRNEALSGTSTPLSSPAALVLEEEDRKLPLNSKKEAHLGKQPRSPTNTLRRRKEIVRRLTELLIVAFLGIVVHANICVKLVLRRWYRELYVWIGVTAVLVLLYPLRLVVWAYWHRTPSRKIPVSLPASFDPAPLLYPPVITVFASLLLSTDNEAVLLPNIILAICSLPQSLVPAVSNSDRGCDLLHWALSCTPLLVSESHWRAGTAHIGSRDSFVATISLETTTLLYPLHQNLCSVLHALTTTSLLTAELQLLSISLIDLLLLSSSPQAIILKSMLWVGGLDIIVSCGQVIRWGISLARVPKWRFKRTASQSKPTSAFLSAIMPWRRVRHDLFHASVDSSSCSSCEAFDEPEDSDGTGSIPSRGLTRSRITTLDGVNSGGTEEKPTSTTNPGHKFSSHIADTRLGSTPLRRHTTPSTENTPRKSYTHTPSGRRKRTASYSVRAFFSLTQEQAIARKWIYAAYVYICIAGAIFLPLPSISVKAVVMDEALRGNEPIGWALGYLFGDLPLFRWEVVSHNLERWICLPPRLIDEPGRFHSMGWVDHLRQSYLGEANTRLVLSAYFLLVIVVGLIVVFRLSPIYEVDTRRKVFHFTMVAMFLPATYVDPIFAALALSIVLALFLLLDLLRASQLPPLSKPLASFLAPYVDGRDLRGPVVISHIFLLIGCAIPLWLSLGSLARIGTGPLEGWDVPTREVGMVSGVVCVGLGDAAASLIGRRYGQRKWLWGGGKSLEGSLAFAFAVLAGLTAARLWLRIGGWPTSGDISDTWSVAFQKMGTCAATASLTEAVLTGGNDNVIVPVVLWTCVKSLGV
ncbi:dolichol kinase [Parahypoxylon ruwenzoriense]